MINGNTNADDLRTTPAENSDEDLMDSLMLDGNAVAGMLRELFGAEVTTSEAECATCHHISRVGAMMAFTRAPGVVLRCPSCESVMVRVVQTPTATYFDARGVMALRIAHRE